MFITVTEFIFVTPLVQFYDDKKAALSSAAYLVAENVGQRVTVYERNPMGFMLEVASFAEGRTTGEGISEVEPG